MNCRGICIRYKANRPRSGMRYISGQKRCQRCEIYIVWDGLQCPCCGYHLRSGPRNSKNKLTNIKAKEEKQQQQIQNNIQNTK
jgi:hypothetical protein